MGRDPRPLLALAFVVMGSGPASAFGAEALGCSVDTATWTANSCYRPDSGAIGALHAMHFAAHNLSGAYS
jgi:hypothetical protein